MFENVIGQEGVVDALKRDIGNSSLPSSLLFHGPLYAGKLTTALELARVLTCEKREGAWDCACSSCKMQRIISHPYVMLLGARDFVDEIYAAADVLKRIDKPAARYLFIRAVMKLIKRFDPIVWEGNEGKISGIVPVLETLNEELELFLPERELPPELDSVLERILESCKKIEKSILTDNIPIHQIRKAAFWSHTTSPGSLKIVILENADRMAESSRNALLKLLEEPPAEAYFILNTTRKEGISPTLKSRLRTYAFFERPSSIVGDILKRVFHETSGEYKTIQEYFLAWDTSPDYLKSESRKFLTSVYEGNSSILYEGGDAGGLLDTIGNRKAFVPFLEELQKNFRAILFDRIETKASAENERIMDSDLYRIEMWNELIKGKLAMYEQLNLRPDRLIESLFYEMRACL